MWEDYCGAPPIKETDEVGKTGVDNSEWGSRALKNVAVSELEGTRVHVLVSVAAVTSIPEFSGTTTAKTSSSLCNGVHCAVVALLHPSLHSRIPAQEAAPSCLEGREKSWRGGGNFATAS